MAKMGSNTDQHIGIGVMTGTSLDGVDLACVEFTDGGYTLLSFTVRPFPAELKAKLADAHQLPPDDFFALENEFSEFIAKAVVDVKEELAGRVDFLGVHGQTILHAPNEKLGYQMLNGGLIATMTNTITVCDFRRADLAQGGQGAPLVPIGDRDLFPEYLACLNLGGFANLSIRIHDQHLAFDVCPCNMLLNELAGKEGMEYDKNGQLAGSGHPILTLLSRLNALPFYAQAPPKSLGREWYADEIRPLFAQGNTADLLRTACEHISDQVASSLPDKGKVLVTGGGAHNDFLMSRIREKTGCEVIIPDKNLVDGKEALIFAYLAKLRLEGKANVSSKLTGGASDLSAGGVYLPPV
jgi:anhydro-N-acetylmuramic acid kinase